MHKETVQMYYRKWYRRSPFRKIFMGIMLLFALLLSCLAILGIVVLIAEQKPDFSFIMEEIMIILVAVAFWMEFFTLWKQLKIVRAILKMDEALLDNLIATCYHAMKQHKGRWIWDIGMYADEDLKTELAQIVNYIIKNGKNVENIQ